MSEDDDEAADARIVLILIILEVLYESYHYNHVIFNRKQQKA